MRGGLRDHLLPGNKQFIDGDPSSVRRAVTAAAAAKAARRRRWQDAFRFALSRDEFLDLFLEDLELPDLIKTPLVESEATQLAPRRLLGHRLAGESHD